MTGDGFSVNIAKLRADGAGVQTAAEQLAERVAAFQVELAGYGEPWGQDDLGLLIGMCYEVISSAAFECFEDNIDELAEQGSGLDLMAQIYEAADRQAEQQFEDFNRNLD